MNGALVIDKPPGMTSHDVVAAVRRLLRERSIGHLGTLDPAATGVLPLLLGRLTRLARFFQSRDKEYEGEIRFGFATTTYDAAGEPLGARSERVPTLGEIEAELPRFRGRIAQVPPPFSAKKIEGRRAYQLARAGKPVALPPAQVEIFELTPLGLEENRLRLHVRCSAGVYMRSLAHDLGEALGAGAHLGPLRRTRVGEFDLAQAVPLDRLRELAASSAPDAAAAPADPAGAGADVAAAGAASVLIPPQRLLPELPAVIAPPPAAARLLAGRDVNLPEFSRALKVRVFTPEGELRAIAIRIAGSLFHPELVFPPE